MKWNAASKRFLNTARTCQNVGFAARKCLTFYFLDFQTQEKEQGKIKDDIQSKYALIGKKASCQSFFALFFFRHCSCNLFMPQEDQLRLGWTQELQLWSLKRCLLSIVNHTCTKCIDL